MATTSEKSGAEGVRDAAAGSGKAPDHSARVYDSVLDLLPSEENPTPMVRVNRMNPRPGSFELLAKLEWYGPFGSIKDRAAWQMLTDLERRGKISAGGRGIVEPTSGNTGISLAAIAAVKGIGFRAVVPNKVPLEKKVLLKLAGAELDVINDELCPSPGMGDGSINMAKSHARAQPDRYTMPNQYENEQNVLAHMRTTGPEIWRQTGGRVTHVFVSLGTCGTVTGVSRFLREKKEGVKIIAVQPGEGHDIPGLRNMRELEVSKLFDPSLIDEILEIEHELAYTRAMELAQKEGLLASPCAGLVYEGARRVIERGGDGDGEGGVGVMIFADSVFKYTSNMARHLPELVEGTDARESG